MDCCVRWSSISSKEREQTKRTGSLLRHRVGVKAYLQFSLASLYEFNFICFFCSRWICLFTSSARVKSCSSSTFRLDSPAFPFEMMPSAVSSRIRAKSGAMGSTRFLVTVPGYRPTGRTYGKGGRGANNLSRFGGRRCVMVPKRR